MAAARADIVSQEGFVGGSSRRERRAVRLRADELIQLTSWHNAGQIQPGIALQAYRRLGAVFLDGGQPAPRIAGQDVEVPGFVRCVVASTTKTGERHGALDFGVAHEVVPHLAGAIIFLHQPRDADIQADDIRVTQLVVE